MFSVRPGFDEGHRREVALLYWSAFEGKLGKIMRPEMKAIDFLTKVADPKFAYSAVDEDNQLLGVAGFKTDEGAFIGGSLSELSDAYGRFGALWRGILLELLERDTLTDTLLMDGIFVAPNARSQGVGSALLDAIGDEASKRNLKKVRLDVIDINPRAGKLYQRKGFVPVKTTNTAALKHLFGFSASTTMEKAIN